MLFHHGEHVKPGGYLNQMTFVNALLVASIELNRRPGISESTLKHKEAVATSIFSSR